MIRTAILAGILLVMLSMAYTRQSLPVISQPAALLEQPQVKAVAHAAKAAVKPAAPVVEAEAAPQPAPRAIAKEELPPAPAPAAEASPQPVAPPAPAVIAQREPAHATAPAPVEAPTQVAAPLSLLPPAAPVQASPQVAEAPRPLTPLVPPVDNAPVQPQPQVAPQVAKAEPPKVEDMPTIAVAKPRAFMPTELELPANPREPVVAQSTTTASASDAPVKTAQSAQPAPKFMTPQERSRDLYRLAREMEETFLDKLAR